MDRLLDGLMEFASARGSHYVKGDVALWEIRRKTAEFGVLLLQFARQMTELDDEDLKSKLMEMQPYVDDFRKVVFCLKFKKAC
ncbi:MAG: hypothetical protein M0Z48_12555 [Nitrospiraceae bacterium]|nr:hypothetical protein [Nitrospiraceae bacterium]